jgi:hypothetical protein
MKPAILIWKRENEELVNERLNSKLGDLISEKKVEDREILGSTQTITGTDLRIEVLTIYDWFDSYEEYDNLLISLVQDAGLNDFEETGVLVGHLDDHGNIYSDYSHFEKQLDNSKTTSDSE